MQSLIYFDIETAPLPELELIAQMPEFEPARNLKDPEKIAADVTDKKRRWIEEAALYAVSGQVLCIGTLRGSVFSDWHGDEESVLRDFLYFMSTEIQQGNVFVGFFCRSFDMGFLMRRAWRYGIKVPFSLWDRRYLSEQIVDVADRWACGSKDPRDRISLDALSKFLGIGQKNGTGKDFAALWASDRTKALEYLRGDLELTRMAWERMQ